MAKRLTIKFVDKLQAAVRAAANGTAGHALAYQVATLVAAALRARSFFVGALYTEPLKEPPSLIMGSDVTLHAGCCILAPVWASPSMEGDPDFQLSSRVDLASRVQVLDSPKLLCAHTVVAPYTTISGFYEREPSPIFKLALPSDGGDCQAMTGADLQPQLEAYLATMRQDVQGRHLEIMRDIDNELLNMLEAMTH